MILRELNEDQSNVSFDWKKIFEEYTFELNLNKSSKNSFKSDFISFNIKGNPINNVNFEISSSVIEKSPNTTLNFIEVLMKIIIGIMTICMMKDFEYNLKLSYKDLFVLTADYNEIDNYTFLERLRTL